MSLEIIQKAKCEFFGNSIEYEKEHPDYCIPIGNYYIKKLRIYMYIYFYISFKLCSDSKMVIETKPFYYMDETHQMNDEKTWICNLTENQTNRNFISDLNLFKEMLNMNEIK